MCRSPRISVIIPAFNEQDAIRHVIADVPSGLVSEILVVDNGSTDETAKRASEMGARIIRENRRGYGWACKAGVAALRPTDIVVFLDGDYSDHPEEMTLLVRPILQGRSDLVIGSRVLGRRERGALHPHARFGNWLVTTLMRLLFRARFTDLGPFRAIRYSALIRLQMEDTTFGWTVEMQIKAQKLGLRTEEVPVSYRRRIGVSKISGTLKGSVQAGYKILFAILKYGRLGGG